MRIRKKDGMTEDDVKKKGISGRFLSFFNFYGNRHHNMYAFFVYVNDD